MERFGQCLCEWMEAEGVAASSLAKRLGFKSKTTVLRALRNECNYAACRHIWDQMSNQLEPSWQVRFNAALRVERIGAERIEQFDAIDAQLFRPGEKREEQAVLPVPPKLSGGRLSVFGCPTARAYRMIDSLLNPDDKIQAVHYLTQYDILHFPEVLSGLINHLPVQRYRATLMEENERSASPHAWNLAVYTQSESSDAWCLLFGAGDSRWYRMEGAAAEAAGFSDQLKGQSTELYRYDELKSGSDYRRFTEDAYRMERGRTAVIVKPTPGMQMLPADVVERTFRDYLSENTEPVAAMREALIQTFEKRVNNFYHRRNSTFLFFSKQAMMSFARTGLLTDQFFAFRPYTREERITCLKSLQAFAHRDSVQLCLLDGPVWPVSFEAYGGHGVLLYPSETNYNSLSGEYRELFLPGDAFAELFSLYASECLRSGADEDVDTGLRHLIAAV